MTVSKDRSAPTLRTERLQLVALQNRHFDAFAELHSDPQSMQYIGDGKPLDRVGAWLHLATLVGHWELRGYGVWAIEELGKHELIGRVGLLHPEGWSAPELNWMLTPATRGRGYAVEAARAALRFAFDVVGSKEVVSFIRPENESSSRVAAKLGGVVSETIEFMGSPMQVFRYRQTT